MSVCYTSYSRGNWSRDPRTTRLNHEYSDYCNISHDIECFFGDQDGDVRWAVLVAWSTSWSLGDCMQLNVFLAFREGPSCLVSCGFMGSSESMLSDSGPLGFWRQLVFISTEPFHIMLCVFCMLQYDLCVNGIIVWLWNVILYKLFTPVIIAIFFL